MYIKALHDELNRRGGDPLGYELVSNGKGWFELERVGFHLCKIGKWLYLSLVVLAFHVDILLCKWEHVSGI